MDIDPNLQNKIDAVLALIRFLSESDAVVECHALDTRSVSDIESAILFTKTSREEVQI